MREGKLEGKSLADGVLSVRVQWKPPKNVGHKEANPFHDVSLKDARHASLAWAGSLIAAIHPCDGCSSCQRLACVRRLVPGRGLRVAPATSGRCGGPAGCVSRPGRACVRRVPVSGFQDWYEVSQYVGFPSLFWRNGMCSPLRFAGGFRSDWRAVVGTEPCLPGLRSRLGLTVLDLKAVLNGGRCSQTTLDHS